MEVSRASGSLLFARYGLPTTASNLVVELDGQSVAFGQSESAATRTFVDTVTVVIFPSDVITTLPISHGSPTTQTDSDSRPSAIASLPGESSQPRASRLTPLKSFSTSAFSNSSIPPSETETPSSPLVSSALTQPSGPPTRIPAEGHTSGSGLGRLDPPAYVGIVLGSLAAFAIAVAIVAWCIRTCHRRRHRGDSPTLPWTQERKDDFSGLEAGVRSSTNWGMDSGSMLETEGTHFKPHGVWDVRELSPSDRYGVVLDSPHGEIRKQIRQQLSPDGVGLEPLDELQPPYPRVPTLRRQLPSHLVNEDLSHQDLAFGPDREGSECEVGTPREETFLPRYLSLQGSGLALPWSRNHLDNNEPLPHPLPPRSAEERLRRAKGPAEQPLDSGRASNTPERSNINDPGREHEGWAGSITTNLVNAFNAVAANIGSLQLDGERQGDGVNPTVARRGTVRRSGFTSWDTSDRNLDQGLVDKASMHSSVPWSLEEVADGAGVVHIHISPSKEDSPGGLSFQRRGRSSSLDSATSSQGVPLVASRFPQVARLKPEMSNHFRASLDNSLSGSQETSYSQSSFVTSGSDFTITATTVPLKPNNRRKNLPGDSKKEKSSPAPLLRPSHLSRVTSTSSATSWSSTSSPSANALVSEALVQRSRRRPYARI